MIADRIEEIRLPDHAIDFRPGDSIDEHVRLGGHWGVGGFRMKREGPHDACA
jgi:hypothetical protein